MIIPVIDAPVHMDLIVHDPVVLEGGVVVATIQARAEEDLLVTGGRAALVKRVAYQHNEFGISSPVRAQTADVVASVELPRWGPVRAGDQTQASISLPVPPDGPGSTNGRLIEIAWCVEISIQIDGGSDAHVTRPLVVLTNSLAQAKAAGRPPLARDRGCVILAVHDLSSRRLVPGTPLSGTLVLSPWRRWTARAVNVALVRREHVHHGPWNGNDPSRNPAYEEKEVDVVVARQDLADRRALEPGRTERLPFILPVPHDLRAPSIQTPEFEISWLLRGWLDRRWLPDPFIEVELHAVTVA